MTHDPQHLTAIAEAQHRAYKRATRRLQHRQRLEINNNVTELPRQASAWLQAVERDDQAEPVEVSAELPQLDEVPA